MLETRVTVNQNGRVVIPAEFRAPLGIPSDEIELGMDDDELRITTQKQRIRRARRLIRQHVW
jgi:AbrB family looped-hinge helix DNA binding protein